VVGVAEPGVLRTVLGNYPHTAALKSGELTDPGVHLDFHDVTPVHRAFAPMVRDEAYDVSELAIVTCLQAIAYGRPVVLLPAVMASRFQRGCLVAPADRPLPAPTELAGRRIGVRAYTQTTGMWLRAHLAEDYGLAPDRVHWITRDGAHVAEYEDPDFVEHGIGDKSLQDLMREGGIDAAIFGNDLPEDDEFVPVIPDAAARDQAWWQRHGFLPINHLVVAGTSACRRDPAAVRAAYGLLRRAADAVPHPPGTQRPTLFGFESLRGPLQAIIDTCLDQGLLPRPLGVDEVFSPAREILGSLAN
jgi:4,5-dihydroxyphthalate decarboxylase